MLGGVGGLRVLIPVAAAGSTTTALARVGRSGVLGGLYAALATVLRNFEDRFGDFSVTAGVGAPRGDEVPLGSSFLVEVFALVMHRDSRLDRVALIRARSPSLHSISVLSIGGWQIEAQSRFEGFFRSPYCAWMMLAETPLGRPQPVKYRSKTILKTSAFSLLRRSNSVYSRCTQIFSSLVHVT